MISACTIVAGNYLAPARVLADSFFAHHPDGSLTILIVDDEKRQLAPADLRIDWRRLADIGLDPIEVHRLAGIYDATELSTAVKPMLLRRLLDEGRDTAIFLDPDILVCGSLDDASRLASRHGIVLTPHTIEPLPKDDRQVDDLFILAAGVYNLGFIAVSPRARPFLDWWWRSTRRQALIDVQRMMFTDQRWVDFVPAFFDHHILRDPGYNVAYWNLHSRHVSWDGDHYLVDGSPLRFFHFSGFEPEQPWLLSRHQGGRPRVLLSEHPILAAICRDYAARLQQAGEQPDVAAAKTRPYGWRAAAAGFELDGRMRRLYWEGLRAAEQGQCPEPPNPFDEADPEGFVAWLNAPVEDGPRRVSRYLYSLYRDRIDVQLAFPDIYGTDAARYADWVWSHGVAQYQIGAELLPLRVGDAGCETAPGGGAAALVEGLTVVGSFRAEMGIGEAARLLTRAADAARLPYATVTYDSYVHRQQHPFEDRPVGGGPYDINVLCLNADSTPRFARDAGAAFFAGRQTIGYWFWEVDPLPAAMHAAFEYVDEVWAATDYVAGIIRAAGRRPVFTIPLPLRTPSVAPQLTRERLGLPRRFIFLSVFDFLSVSARKNPLGLIEAFTRAFVPGEGPVLVIKSINGHLRVPELEQLRMMAAERPDILVIDRHYSHAEQDALVGACDCFVSLHRAEGLGLTMAEAMALGKPVVATGYSGNLHFMTPDNSYLADYTLSTVPPGCFPYPEGARWAAPDLDHAARLMREVYTRPADAARVARRGRLDILERHGAAAAAAALVRRLNDIRGDRRSRVAVPSVPVPPATATAVEPLPEPRRPDPQPAAHRVAAPLRSAVGAVQALKPHFAQFGAPQVAADGGAFPAVRKAAQRALFRVLRPYWFQQRQLQNATVDALLSSVTALADDVAALDANARAFEEVADRRLLELTARQQELADAKAATRTSLAALFELFAAADADRVRFVERTPDGARLGYGSSGNGSDGAIGHRTHAYAYDGAPPAERLLRTRQRVYLPLLRHRPRILDIGCGRGGMLDLLRVANLPAIGVDIDPEMVRHCRANAHTVEHADALQFLREQPGRSVGAIFTARLMEELSFEQLHEFLHLCRSRLESGGLLIAETANPRGAVDWLAHTAQLRDAATPAGATRAISPQVALALCQLAGFEQAHVMFPTGTGDLDTDRHTEAPYAVLATAGADDLR